MVGGQLVSVVRFLRRVAGAPSVATDSDGSLLERFASSHDEEAFDVLIRRHGAMVLGVCRRVLSNADDADDAFQATFLVLVQSARSISRQDSVGSWLYGVAYRTALKGRARAARRRAREKVGAAMFDETASGNDPSLEAERHELRPFIDQELNRLSEKYRAPVVLCYLEGKTNEEAAQELGWTKGTVSGRLARARDILRTRFARQGMTLSVGALGAALSGSTASAALPSALIQSTKVAALASVAGKAAATGAISASVSALTEGVMHAMFLTKLKIVASVLLAVGLMGAGGVWTYGAVAGKIVAGNNSGKSQGSDARGQDGPAQAKSPSDLDIIQGTWVPVSVEQDGKNVQAEDLADLKLLFKASKLFTKYGENGKDWRQSDFKLHPNKNPKVIELITPDESDKPVKGLYALKGDTLKLCINNRPGGEEPTEFTAKEGTGLVIFELRRAKAGEALQEPKNAEAFQGPTKVISSNNLKQIVFAMLNYNDANGSLPSRAVYSKDGKPLLSWRVLILPYIDQDALYQAFKLDEPWDSEHNKKLLDQMPPLYRVGTKPKSATFYQVFTGPDTVFEGKIGTKLADIVKGAANTLMVVEAGEAVPWTKPDDLVYDPKKKLPALGGVFKGGFHAVFGDGSMRFLLRTAREEELRGIIQRK
ncbi:MAG: sigma-70 family RNA polymerase sigma factor [Planctomycetes bacterium]|nr:sigma-70 family RNA polymerase sigma factor [Planctomycetota bacterium]